MLSITQNIPTYIILNDINIALYYHQSTNLQTYIKFVLTQPIDIVSISREIALS